MTFPELPANLVQSFWGLYKCPIHGSICFIFDSHLLGAFKAPEMAFPIFIFDNIEILRQLGDKKIQMCQKIKDLCILLT